MICFASNFDLNSSISFLYIENRFLTDFCRARPRFYSLSLPDWDGAGFGPRWPCRANGDEFLCGGDSQPGEVTPCAAMQVWDDA